LRSQRAKKKKPQNQQSSVSFPLGTPSATRAKQTKALQSGLHPAISLHCPSRKTNPSSPTPQATQTLQTATQMRPSCPRSLKRLPGKRSNPKPVAKSNAQARQKGTARRRFPQTSTARFNSSGPKQPSADLSNLKRPGTKYGAYGGRAFHARHRLGFPWASFKPVTNKYHQQQLALGLLGLSHSKGDRLPLARRSLKSRIDNQTLAPGCFRKTFSPTIRTNEVLPARLNQRRRSK